VRLRNLRSRLTLVVVVILGVVLVVGGAVVARDVDRQEHQNLDDRLRRTSELTDESALAVVDRTVPEQDERLNQVLRATGSGIYVTVNRTISYAAGASLPGLTPGASLQARRGFSVRTIDGDRIRIYTKVLRQDPAVTMLLHATTSLRPVTDRRRRMIERLVAIGLAMLLTGGLATWLAADLILRPLRRLRRATASIEGDDDLRHRVPEEGPTELREVARSFNGMLERLGRSAEERNRALEATRRFAADAGHELRTPLTSVQAALSVVHRHPDVDPATRASIVGDALAEQRRLVELLDGLQALARGDARPGADEPVDVVDVARDVVADIAGRHPDGTFDVDAPDAAVIVDGWEPGLRLLVKNLVENAARHGRPGGRVTVAVRVPRDARGPELVVDDDGDGIPAVDRERIFEPFHRVGADNRGTGLGLALVRQQVGHHGATITVGDAPGGGARFVVRFAPRTGRRG